LVGAGALVLALLPVAGGLLLTYEMARERARAAVESIADKVAERVRIVLWQAEGALASASYPASRLGCGDDLIGAFSGYVAAYSWVRDMAFVTADNRLACTSFGAIVPPIDVGRQDQGWIKPGDSPLVLKSAGATPFMPGQSVVAAYRLPSGVQAGAWVVALISPQAMIADLRPAALGDGGWLQVTIAGTPVAGLASPASSAQVVEAGQGAAGDAGAIVARRELGIFEGSVTAARPGASVVADWRRTAAAYTAIGGLFGLGLAVAAVKLAGRRPSPGSDLADALDDGEFEVHYQPVIDLQTERCIGAEALIRWQRPGDGMVPPDHFIKRAEDTGLIVPMTRWLMDRVGDEVGARLRADPDLHIGINLAPVHFANGDVVGDARRAVERAGISPAQIIFEVTERGLVDEAGCRQVIDALKAAGHAIAIDDFGTGYSSLSYVGTFRLDYLKIDKAFVQAIGTGAATAELADVIIDMAKTLRLRIIAEGAETAGHIDHLRERGVDLVQGWYYAKPLPAPEFLLYLDKGGVGRQQRTEADA
jgi:sensor c-di-GMP phosphodiesterase-like protein